MVIVRRARPLFIPPSLGWHPNSFDLVLYSINICEREVMTRWYEVCEGKVGDRVMYYG